jgi:hypothetical protein
MKRIYSFSIIHVILLILISSCETEVDPKLLPLMNTTEVIKITEATAYSGGNISSDAGFDVISRGVCWSETPNPTIESNITIDAAGTGVFESRIVGLNPSTTYYIRAYATNKKGTSYGLQLTFKTKSLIITTTTITAATINTALSGGTIVTDGDSLNVAERGICWDTSANPTISNSKKSSGKGKGKYSCLMSELQIATHYFVRAYATNLTGTFYGDEISFFTTNGSMTLNTSVATSITAISATIGGSVPNDGGSAITERGFCISKSQNPTITNKISNGSGIGSFSSNINGLDANTTYYARVFATNSIGTMYGNEINFTTKDGIITLTTNEATSITATSATIGGSITSDGGASITVRGFCWSKTPNPTTADGKSTSTGTTGSYATNISGLSIGSTYYVRAYATNAVGTYYGNEVSYTTQNGVIRLTTTSAFSVTALTAISGGNVTSDGGGVFVTDRGVCWNTSPNPTLGNNKIQTGTGSGIFTSSITNLSASTTYYVRAYATNSVGTVYGNEVGFTTQNGIIALSTTNISFITSFTSKSGGTITTDGGATITAGGVCWSTNSNPTISNYKTNDATGIGSFTSSISGLTLGVTYYVRAYATNMVDTYYGNELVFTTALAIGDNYQGGKIAYFFKSGDVGFVAGETHGIIAAPTDQSLNISWNNGSIYSVTNASGTAIGTGKTNTDIIVGSQGAGSYAAILCSSLVLYGYSDWFLPSKDELNTLYINRALIGGFVSEDYWSSTEYNNGQAWLQSFSTGIQISGGGRIKSNLYNVRAIRNF